MLPAAAQMTGRPVRHGSMPVGAGSGPVSGMSTNVRRGSRSVGGQGSVRSTSSGPLSGNAVRGASTGSMHSGPLSSLSVGSVATKLPPAAAPAPPADYFPPANEGFTEEAEEESFQEAGPVYDLEPLSERLRAVEPLPRDAPATAATESEAELPEHEPDELANEEVGDTGEADGSGDGADIDQDQEGEPSDEAVIEPAEQEAAEDAPIEPAPIADSSAGSGEPETAAAQDTP